MKKAIVLFLLLLAAWLTGVGVAYAPQWQQAQRLQQDGLMLFPRALAVTDQTFINQQGQRMALSELQGRNVLLFFGYTFCPDICPTTLADLSRTWKQLPADIREQWQVVLVSVDPERDSPQSLQPYMAYFNKSFLGLTGNADGLGVLAAELNAVYSKVERGEGVAYLMDHSANLVILDKQGAYRGYIAPPHNSQRLVPVLQALSARLQ